MASEAWISGEQHTVPQLLRERLERHPDGPYLDLNGETFTAREMDVAANRVANALLSLGVGKGDRVASLLENGAPAAVAWWGIVKTGAIAVPINTAFKGDYLRHQLANSGARLLFVQGDLCARAAAVAGDLDELRHGVVVGEPEAELPGVAVHAFEEILGAEARDPEAELTPSDLATFIYTGGTTGPSKGCALSHNYHRVLAEQVNACWRRRREDVLFNPLPLFHFNAISTALLGSLLVDGSAVITRRFSVSHFWPELCRTGATIASLLGSLATLLANADDHPQQAGLGTPGSNRSLRLLAAAPMPLEIDRKLRQRFGIETFSGAYGTTECSLLSWQPPGVENRPNAAGIVNREYFDVRIFDGDDNELPRGSDGEIVCRPRRPHVMFEGYWGNAEATVGTSGNWWYHTGDVGRIDADDFLTFVDRKADYLRRRGENISSYEVEKVFHQHPQIKDVAVHAVPSELTEDDVKVTCTLQPGATLREEELCRWASERLPYFAVPRYVEFRDESEMPRSPVGRILKVELRAQGVTARTWDLEGSGIPLERR